MKINQTKIKALGQILACIVFMFIFLTLLTWVERVLMEDNADRAVVAHTFIPPDSADVVFIGSSHVYGAIIPQKLMDDYGITSVNAASGNQRMWQSVTELEWFLQRQKPRVAVVDLFSVGFLPRNLSNSPDESYNDSYYSFLGLVPRAIPWTNPLKLSAMVQDTLLDPYAPPYLSTISVRHSDVWDLNDTDFLKAQDQSVFSNTFNYFYLYETLNQSPDPVEADPSVKLPDYCREQLLRLCRLCKANGIDLIFIALPHWADSTWLGYLEQTKILAQENGASFIGMNTLAEESGFDYATDMADVGHMNYGGALKTTDYIGRYLTEHFNLPDRRKDADPKYDVWKKRPNQYEAFDTAYYIQFVKDLDEWVSQAEYLNDDNMIILATNQAPGTVTEDTVNGDILSLLNLLGLEQADTWLEDQSAYFAVLQGTQVLVEEAVQGDLDYATLLDNSQPLTIRTKGGKSLAIKIDNQNLALGNTGLNILIYDKVNRKAVDSVSLGFDQEDLALTRD